MFEPPLHVSGGFGVIDMVLLSVIRRWHFREHLSIRQICRRTGLSLNTIRKYLRTDGVEPAYKIPERRCLSWCRFDGHAVRLTGLPLAR